MQAEIVDGSIRHKDYQGSYRSVRRLPWDGKEFIAWDGEGIQVEPSRKPTEFTSQWIKEYNTIHGQNPSKVDDLYDLEEATPQPYVLLANSKGDSLIRETGLGTIECFEFILAAAQRYKASIFVGFGFTYDVAQILKDLPVKKLEQIWRNNKCKFQQYRIHYFPRRWFRVTHIPTKRTARIFDVIGFFQSSFLTACEDYLGQDDPDFTIIKQGKDARDTFRFDELRNFIMPYNDTELKMLVKLMNFLRLELHNVGLDLTSWHGPGAIANQVLKRHGIKEHMSTNVPEEVSVAAQHAYAGGRFEQFYIGSYKGNVYEYDIRSAYPTAIAKLPSFSEGTWEYAETFEHGTFSVWFIEYKDGRNSDKPQPLFCRAKDGRVSFPKEVSGWYWEPEASLVPGNVQYGYVWRTSQQDKPFAFVGSMYEIRRKYKHLKRPIKLALNSIYGKLAQIVGGKEGPPPWHQLEWAGWVTSYVRAMIYRAIQLNPTAIIAVETDAVFSTEPLPLALGEGLGEWELTTYSDITYLQSGFYYATTNSEVVCRYRGMDRDRKTKQPAGLSYRSVLDHLSHSTAQEHWRTPPLRSSTTRFINIGFALRTGATFRSWETKPKKVSLDNRPGKHKRFHMNCPRCKEGLRLSDCLHPMAIGGYAGASYPHPLPWKEKDLSAEFELYLALEKVEEWQ